MDIALMIEGQDGLTWPRWQRLAQAAEDLSFAALYRLRLETDAPMWTYVLSSGSSHV